PRVLAAAQGICRTGGHGWRFGREADGPDDVRKAVREQLKVGADVIKLFATGGVMTPGVEPGSSQLTPEEIRAAIEEARKAGRRTAAHAQATDGIAACVDAGIGSIEHGIFLTEPIAAKMVTGGMSPLAARRSATSVAARVLGLHEETGRIAPGLAADLIAVGGDPGERVEALDDVRLVIANGRIAVNRLKGGA